VQHGAGNPALCRRLLHWSDVDLRSGAALNANKRKGQAESETPGGPPVEPRLKEWGLSRKAAGLAHIQPAIAQQSAVGLRYHWPFPAHAPRSDKISGFDVTETTLLKAIKVRIR
jgi:hypothetical protein